MDTEQREIMIRLLALIKAKIGSAERIQAGVKFMDRDDMENLLTNTTDDAGVDNIFHSFLDQIEEPDDDDDDHDDIADVRRGMRFRMESVAMLAAVVIVEHAKWQGDKPGYITTPVPIVESLQTFTQFLSGKMGHLIARHVEKIREAQGENEPPMAEAKNPEEYCHEGCNCPACEQLRTKHAAQYGGEVIKVEGPSFAESDSPF